MGIISYKRIKFVIINIKRIKRKVRVESNVEEIYDFTIFKKNNLNYK